MWVPVTTAWRVLRLRMEERPPIWRVAVNILYKQSRTADKEWSSSWGGGGGLGKGLKSPHCKNYPVPKCFLIGQGAGICEGGNEL